MASFKCPKCGRNFESADESADAEPICPDCVATAADETLVPAGSYIHVHPDQSIAGFLSARGLEGGVSLTEDGDDVPAAGGGRRYRLGELVASGGMGGVFSAMDLNIQRSVAMKVMKERRLKSDLDLLRFIEEAQITGQLEHPGIVPVYELGIDGDGNVFYTMKYVHGRTLLDILNGIKEGNEEIISEYPLNRLLNIFMKVCEAIAFAHAKGVVHRDLKPENIMVGSFGEVQVLDWGVAKIVDPRQKPSPTTAADDGQPLRVVPSAASRVETVRGTADESRHTMVGRLVGTPRYMAPEQVYDRRDQIDGRTDVYALGCILYYILTLHPPIDGNSAQEVIVKVADGDFDRPSYWNPEGGHRDDGLRVELKHLPGGLIPDALTAVVMKAMAQKREDRYQSVKDLQADIEAWQSGFATTAEEATLWRHFLLMVGRHRREFRLLASASLILLLVVIYSIVKLDIERQAAVKARKQAETAFAEANELRQQAESARDDATKQRAKAERALADFKAEQKRRFADRVASAPMFLNKARKTIAAGQFADAVLELEVAAEYSPDLADAHMLLAQLHIVSKKFAAAKPHLRRYEKLKPGERLRRKADTDEIDVDDITVDDANDLLAGLEEGTLELSPTASDAVNLLRLCELAEAGYSYDVNRALIEIFVRRDSPTPLVAALLEKADQRLAMYREILNRAWPESGNSLTISPVGRMVLNFSRREITDLSPLKGLPIEELILAANESLTDLAPIRNLKLRVLNISATKVADLRPLSGMRLQRLYAAETPIADLSPLKGMPLTHLHLSATRIKSLAPLRGMPLQWLQLHDTAVTDLSPIYHCPLERLGFTYTDSRNIEPLRQLKSLQYIDGCASDYQIDTAARFWQRVDSGEIGIQSALIRRNPQYLGDGSLTMTDGKVTAAVFNSTSSSYLADLAPLRGQPITRLKVYSTLLTDLRPLRGMPLQQLALTTVPTADLAVLHDIKTLVSLTLYSGESRDLAPLRGLKLKTLSLAYAPAMDLTPVAGLPVESLLLVNSKISDLRPLTKMKALKHLDLTGSTVVNVKPLAGLKLETVRFSPETVRVGIDVLQNMDSLKTVNGVNAFDYWLAYDREKESGWGTKVPDNLDDVDDMDMDDL